MRPMSELQNDLTSYADDTYGIIEITSNQISTPVGIDEHLNWLKSSGMIVNESKTEMMIMHRFDKQKRDFKINESLVKTKSSINVLGIIFNQNLNWSEHVVNTINSCQRILHGLKIVRKFFNQSKFKQLMTAYLFSKLFYAFEVWSYDLLNFETKSRLNSFYYKCCRLIIGDHENAISRNIIDTMIKRATPTEFSNYVIVRTIIKNMNSKNSPLVVYLNETTYTITRKPNQFLFYDASINKIGRNAISNRLSDIFKMINFNCTNIT